MAGVTVVHNLLAVALPAEDTLEDADLEQRVNGALAASRVPDGARVTAREGDIFLTGTVRDRAQRAAAEEAAAGVGGVFNITNLIDVQDGM